MSSYIFLSIFSLLAVPKSIASVFPFFRFMSSSFLQNQLARLLTSSFKWPSLIFSSPFNVKITVSSAEVTIFVCFNDSEAKTVEDQG